MIHKKQFITSLLLLFLFSKSYCQLFNDGGKIAIGGSALMRVDGMVNNQQGGQIEAGGNIYVSGDWVNSDASIFNANNSNIHLDGSTQNIYSGGDAFNILTAEGGDKTLLDNTTVNSTLSLNNVKVLAQSNILTISPGGTVVRTHPNSTSTEYVIGSLRKNFSNSQSPSSQIFDVGTTAIYCPVEISFESVSSSGVFTATAVDGAHPSLNSSYIDPAKHSNMYWNIINGGVIYAGSEVRVYHNGAITGGDPTKYIIQQFSSPVWTSPDMGNVNNVSAQSFDHNFYGDFLAGEIKSVSSFPCENCISSFAPEQGKQYVLSAWAKESNGQSFITYASPMIRLSFNGSSTTYTITANGNIIDGWQRIEQAFTVPAFASDIKIDLVNTSTNSTTEVFFDDIRIHPFDANMKSFVYDPLTLRLSAELDNNNYATFYEYDEEGALIRVKKETERGIVTIKENKNNTVKR